MIKRRIPSGRAAIATVVMVTQCGSLWAAPLSLSNVPLFVASNTPANVMMMFGNSNSMDEDPTGLAVGSASPASKSEIARSVVKSLVATYQGTLNMGLMAYQQVTNGSDPVRSQALHASAYDASYNPLNYNASFTGARASLTKKFRTPNVTDPGSYIYYNVDLPFYASSSQGNGFCYSATAKAFNNGEDPVNGPWDTYNCYATKIGPSDALPTDSASTAAAGYSNFQFASQFFPTDSDLGQGITDFGRFLTWNFVSPTWFSNGSPGGGYVHIPIKLLDSTQAGKINTKLGTSQFSTNAPFDPNFPLQNAGLTPLEGTMITAQSYFAGQLSDSAQGGPLSAPPQSCGKNFMVVLTNGLPSVTKTGQPSADTTTMLANVATATGSLYTQAKVSTYVVGFALPFGVNPTQLDTIAQAGNTNAAYNASDQATLTQTLGAVFSDIIARTGAAASVSLNSTSISSGSRAFQARFSSGDWSGQLLDFTLGANGTPGAVVWDAAQVLNTISPSSRTILTYKPSTGKGIAFRWPTVITSLGSNDLDSSEVTALNANPSGVADARGSLRLDWLRGSGANEGTGSTNFRQRPVTKLGDIVDSAPLYVGPPAYNYSDAGYASFKASMAARSPVIYVGANDGMLHGFDAGSGREVLAYVPSRVYPNLSVLTGSVYAHRFYVDASPVAGDVSLSGTWHTVVVSGLGAGGRGIFGLDITDPTGFSEANAANLVRFEFSDANDGDVGYVLGKPSIVKLNNGKWAAVFGNGYNGTTTGQATLFVVDIETGALIKKISTGVGSVATPNGLGTIAAIDDDGNRTVDFVYAADLQGNLWKFDLSDSSPANWALAYAGQPLFSTATAGFGALPITAMPEVTRHPKGGYMVVFGTGKYLEAADVNTTTANYFFGIWDNGTSPLVAASKLLQQTVLGTQSGSDGSLYRLTSANPIDWTTYRGWYLGLPDSGERDVTDPILRNGRVIFTSMEPSSAPCSAGGTSWLMELDYLSGGRLKVPPFDINADGTINGADKLSGNIPSGRKLNSIGSMPAVQQGLGTADAPLERKLITESSAALTNVLESGNPAATRRTSWQQLR